MKKTSKRWLGGALLVVLVVSGFSWAQPGAGGGMRGGGRNFDPEQMRQRMSQMMMERLGVSTDEWKVIEPLYTKVSELQRSTRGRGRFGMRGGPGGPGGPGQDGGRGNRRMMGGPDGEETAVQKAQQALSDLLENESTTPEQIKESLVKLRTEKEKARQELAKAQEDLKKVLTLKQEAQLVLMGTLD